MSDFIPKPSDVARARALGDALFRRTGLENPTEPVAVCVVAFLDAAVRMVQAAHWAASGEELPAAAACEELLRVVESMQEGERRARS